MRAEHAGEHAAVVVEHRIVAILEQRVMRHAHLFAGDAPAIDAAAQHPIDAAMTVVRAAIAVFTEGPAELGQHEDHGIVPLLAQGFGIGGKAPSQAVQIGRQRAAGAAFIDMGVPAAHVHESQPVLRAHESRHALGGQFESLGTDGTAVGRLHLLLHRLRHLLLQLQTFRHRRFEMAAGIHAAQGRGLGGIKG